MGGFQAAISSERGVCNNTKKIGTHDKKKLTLNVALDLHAGNSKLDEVCMGAAKYARVTGCRAEHRRGAATGPLRGQAAQRLGLDPREAGRTYLDFFSILCLPAIRSAMLVDCSTLPGEL